MSGPFPTAAAKPKRRAVVTYSMSVTCDGTFVRHAPLAAVGGHKKSSRAHGTICIVRIGGYYIANLKKIPRLFVYKSKYKTKTKKWPIVRSDFKGGNGGSKGACIHLK